MLNNSWNYGLVLNQDGTLLVGKSGSNPVATFLTSTGHTLSYTFGPGSINIEVNTSNTFFNPLLVFYGGTGRTVLTRFGVLIGEGSNKVNVTPAGTSGQILISSTTGDPLFSKITSSGGTLTFTVGPNSLNLEVNIPNFTFLNPWTVPYGGTGRTVLTSFGVLIGEGSHNVNVTAAGTSGQILIASTTGDPAFATVTSSGGTITFSFGPNSLNIEVSSASSFFNPLQVVNGGTGRTVLTTFGVLIGEGSNNVNVTAPGTHGQALIASTTGDPRFSTITSSGSTLSFTAGPNSLNIDLRTPIGVALGGSGRTILTSFGVLIGEGSNSVNVTAAGTQGQILIASTTGDPAFASVTSSGGTLSFTVGPNSLNLDLRTPVNATLGGTGRTILTTFGVLVGEGSNNVNVTAAGTSGQVLIGSTTGDPKFATITSSGSTVTFTFGPNSLNVEVNASVPFFNPLQVANGGTGRTILTTFGVLIGEGSNNINVTAAGTQGQVLIASTTGDPKFSTLSSSGNTLSVTVGPNSLNIDIRTPISVQFGGTGRTILTTFGVLIGEGSNNVNVTAAGTHGQALLSSTTGDPKFSTLTSSGGSIGFTSGPNSLNLDLASPIAVSFGGTGRTILTTFGVLIGEGSNNVKVTAAGTNGQLLIASTTGDPAFASLSSTGSTIFFTVGPNSLNLDLSIPLSVSSGGTGRTILTRFGVLIGEGSNNIDVTAAGTHGQVLLSSTTGDPAFASLTSSGGTLSFTVGPDSLNIDLKIPVLVSSGGTGRTVLTRFGVIIGEGSNNVNVTAAGTSGQVLIASTTGDPAFASITSTGGSITFTFGPNSLNIDVNFSGGTFFNPLRVVNGGTGRTILTTFGVLVGEGSNNVNVTAAGTQGQVLIASTTGDPAFSTMTSSGGTLTFSFGPNSLNVDLKIPVITPFGGTGDVVLTTFGVLLGEGSNNVNVTAAGTNGQLLIGSTTGDPAFSTVTSTGGTVAFTAGSNSLNIDLVLPIGAFAGGTGRTILTTFGVLIGEGSNNVDVTAPGTHGQVLIASTTGDPAFNTITSSGGTLTFAVGPNSLNIDLNTTGAFFNPLPVANGGTGRTILTTFGVLIGEGSNSVNVTAAGTQGQVLIASTTGDPAFNAITSSGGTLSFTVGPNSLNIDLRIPLPVRFGGTGRTILTTFGVLVGEGSNNINVTAAGTHGQVLIASKTGDPAFNTITSSGNSLTFTFGPNSLNVDLIVPVKIQFGGTGMTFLTTFGVLVGEGSNNVNVTAAGTNGQVLISSTTGDPAFASISSTGGSVALTAGPNSLNIDIQIPVTVQSGGTGRTILTTFGVLIGEGSNSVNVTAAGTHGQVLVASTTGDPAFATITSSGNTIAFVYGPNSLNLDMAVPIPVNLGGTGQTILTTFGVLIGEGSNDVNVTAAGTHGQLLISSTTGDPAFSTMSSTGGSIVFTAGPNSLNLDTAIPISPGTGGTGRTVLTRFGVLIGEGSSPIDVTAAGTHGQVLIASTTGDPAFATITSSGGSLSFTVGPNSLNIDLVSPVPVTAGGTGRSVLTTFGVLIGEGSNSINVTAAGTNGQILIASTTGDPAFARLTSSGNTISITFGPNSLNIDLRSINSSSVGNGGTGRSVLTRFGVLIGEGSNPVDVTAAGTHGQLLIASTTGDPAFASLTSSGSTVAFTTGPNSLNIDFLTPIVVPFGGTGRTVLTRFGVLIGEGSNSVNVTAAGTHGQILIASTTGDPRFSTLTSSGSTLNFSVGPNSLNIDFNVPIPVNMGGTGRTILTRFGVLIGEGSSSITAVIGTHGQVLIASTTGDPAFARITSSGNSITFTFGPRSLNMDINPAGNFFNPVQVANGGTGRTILTRFGVLVGEGSQNVNVTAAGTHGQLLIASTTGDPRFSTVSSSGNTVIFTTGPNSLNLEATAGVTAFQINNISVGTTSVTTNFGYYSVDSSGGTVTLTFPNSVTTGTSWVVKDRTGNSALFPIVFTTVSGTVGFDGDTIFNLINPFGALSVMFSNLGGNHYEIF